MLPSFLSNGLMHFLIWLVVRDSECPDCRGMLHKLRSRSTHAMYRCQVCEKLWVRRNGVYESHVSLINPKEPQGNYLR
ncbi:MAG: hypothetical protein QOC61_194 [Acidobacteriota bacterium]|jgi:hypothetical protein|nr:hypothetical protein [Acidobacteriota bacterium]MDT7778521.1 hypothetical protein [Acidobacteriota bacterium]